MNVGESTGPLLLAIVLPALVAAVIGAMMFYGRISDVYMGVITLVVTLILFKFMNATAGDAYRIGTARLGGFNGIPAFPILNVPGDPERRRSTARRSTTSSRRCCLLCYLLCRWILRLVLRPRADRHPRERGARRAARLQRAGLQDRDLHDQRRRWPASPAACSRTGPRSSRRACSASASRPRCIIWMIVGGLGTLVGPIARRDRAGLPEAAARPADADRQLAGARRDPGPGRAAAAERPRCRR